jgi:hypothetical protein
MTAKRFTFKTEKSTGRFSSFYPDVHHIKLNKIECGYITDKKPHLIKLQVLNERPGNLNCKWRWVTLVAEFWTLEEVKAFLNANFEMINKKYTIWLGD